MKRSPSARASAVRSGGFNVHAGRGGRDVGERAIPIMHEIPWRVVVREGVPELLRDPHGRRMGGDGYMHDASPVVGEDDEHEQQAARDRRHHEEVGSHDLARMVVRNVRHFCDGGGAFS
jgi:hypothetical protein